MRDVFRGWKRKSAVVTLIMACVLLAGWLRSNFRTDSLTIQLPGRARIAIGSSDGAMLFSVSREPIGGLKFPIMESGWFEFRSSRLQPAAFRLIVDPWVDIFDQDSEVITDFRMLGFQVNSLTYDIVTPLTIRITGWVVDFIPCILLLTLVSVVLLVSKQPPIDAPRTLGRGDQS